MSNNLVDITAPELYEILLDELDGVNKRIRKTFIDSPDNVQLREHRDRINKKIKKFTDEFPEVLI